MRRHRARATHWALAPCGSEEKIRAAEASGASSVATKVTAVPGSSSVSPRCALAVANASSRRGCCAMNAQSSRPA